MTPRMSHRPLHNLAVVFHNRGMHLIERRLLEAVARAPGDCCALSVLADYWLENGNASRGKLVHLQCGAFDRDLALAGEEARLTPHMKAWREPLIKAGFNEEDLAFDRGILQWPIAITGDIEDPIDLFRISPRIYRIHDELQLDPDHRILVADVVTPMRAGLPCTERVAIKVPSRRDCDMKVRRSIEREHTILSQLAHPNVAAVLGWAITETGRGLVTRWAGGDAGALLRATRHLPLRPGVAFAVSVAVQLCDALDAVHRAGIVHAGVRPEHAAVAGDGTVTLIGFDDVRAAEWGPRGWLMPELWHLRYLSPEAVIGLTADERTDVFSLALVLAHLVDGEHPFRHAKTIVAFLVALRDRRFVLPEVPPPLAAVLLSALARHEVRISTVVGLRKALVAAAAAARLEIGPPVIAQRLCELGVAS